MIRNMTTGTNRNMTMAKEKSCIKKELGMTVEVAPEIRQLKLEIGINSKNNRNKIVIL